MTAEDSVKIKGPWTASDVDRFLAGTRVPLRLACNGASGHPVIVSLWFLPGDGRLWCATQQTARVARLLARDPRCAFEVAEETPPYRGVRGQGRAALESARGEEILRALIDRYLGDGDSRFARWLLERADGETAIAIEPRTWLTWDYTRRMEGAT